MADSRQNELSPLWVVVPVGTAVLIGIIPVFWLGGAALVWAGACLVSGVMVGFLFGIPRTLQSEQAGSKADTEADAATPQQGYAQRVNTNLEQISDWLTKILVGLGLTQLGNVPARLGEAAAYVASGMPDQRGATVFAGGMIVYFSIVGFIGGYLFTRLFLARLFWAADVWGFERRFARIEGKVEETKGEVNMNHLIVSSLQDLARTDVPRSTLEEDIRGLEALRKDFGAHRTLHIVLGRLYDRFGRYDDSIGVLSSFLEEKARQGQGGDKDSADVLFNRACDYSMKSEGLDGEQKEKLQQLALRDLKESITRSPENASEADSDPDFAPIRDREDFKSLVRRQPTSLSSQ
jgi:hypothetical protein